ncbi:MAG: 1-deoxy-D-xylulose-5-phosphate reductoisomerase [Chloroflexota bacterium]|nr:1-deoxy-D-xylulose-5-phosphate reductoisomerase [Chloroflexota bacterium]
MWDKTVRVGIFGSTGSIGTQTLEVIGQLQSSNISCTVAALATGNNVEKLAEQIDLYKPDYAWISNESKLDKLGTIVSGKDTKLCPPEEIAASADIDVLVVASNGLASLRSVIIALETGKRVALANKESLVVGGQAVIDALVQGEPLGAKLLPVDSEHSALWQCIWGENTQSIKELILTASGGAFRDYDLETLANVTAKQALEHPTWTMGPKVTIDSATLFNKGLEVVEAKWLFDITLDKIKVLQHSESIVHSLVTFVDGSVKAQLGDPDMKLPIQIAITYPDRINNEPAAPLDLAHQQSLNFKEIETERYPALQVALDAGAKNDTSMAAVAGADESAVQAFLDGHIGFTEIPVLLQESLNRHNPISSPTLDDSLDAEAWGRQFVNNLVGRK